MCPEMYVGLHTEYPLFLSHLNQNCKTANINCKNFRASDLMKCFQHCSVVCMQTDRQIYGEYNIIHFLPLIRNHIQYIQKKMHKHFNIQYTMLKFLCILVKIFYKYSEISECILTVIHCEGNKT